METNNFTKRTPEGWVLLDTHRVASDHIGITDIPVRTRHADAQAIANISFCASRRHPIQVSLQVGAEDSPGWRSKDGEAAQQRRKEVAEDAAKHLGVDVRAITVMSRYNGLALMVASAERRAEAEREQAKERADELGPTHYRVTVDPQSWDDRGQHWVSANERETLRRTADLDAAKAAFAKAWAEREQHASAAGAPIYIELDVVTTNEDGLEELETYSGEGNPAGDSDWHSYYGGEERTGWWVLWAHNMGGNYDGPMHDATCLGIIGPEQARHIGIREWELRHRQDKGGAMYAEELYETREDMLAAIPGVLSEDLYERQDILKELSSGNEPVVQAERFERDGDTHVSAILPDGEEFNAKLEYPEDAATFYAFSYDGETHMLVRIELDEVEETEEENA